MGSTDAKPPTAVRCPRSGVRATWFQHSRIQPSFSLNLGSLLAAREIPVNNAYKFNFLFSFGPGVQVFVTSRSSVRLRYIYRHISNAAWET